MLLLWLWIHFKMCCSKNLFINGKALLVSDVYYENDLLNICREKEYFISFLERKCNAWTNVKRKFEEKLKWE